MINTSLFSVTGMMGIGFGESWPNGVPWSPSIPRWGWMRANKKNTMCVEEHGINKINIKARNCWKVIYVMGYVSMEYIWYCKETLKGKYIFITCYHPKCPKHPYFFNHHQYHHQHLHHDQHYNTLSFYSPHTVWGLDNSMNNHQQHVNKSLFCFLMVDGNFEGQGCWTSGGNGQWATCGTGFLFLLYVWTWTFKNWWTCLERIRISRQPLGVWNLFLFHTLFSCSLSQVLPQCHGHTPGPMDLVTCHVMWVSCRREALGAERSVGWFSGTILSFIEGNDNTHIHPVQSPNYDFRFLIWYDGWLFNK